MGKVFFRKCVSYVIFVFLFISLFEISSAQLIISEADPNRGFIEFENISDVPLDMNNYTFRSNNRGFLGIDRIIMPGENISYTWPHFTNSFGEFSIHNIGQFNADNYVDYVIWSDRDTTTQELTFAVQAGVWDGMTRYLTPPPIQDPTINLDHTTLSQLNFAARNGLETNSLTWGLAENSLHRDALCFDQSFGINERVLYEESNGYFDYEAETLIRSNQLITSTSKVDYDSSAEVILENGFEIQQGAEFEAFIDGCNIGTEGIHE